MTITTIITKNRSDNDYDNDDNYNKKEGHNDDDNDDNNNQKRE